MEINKRAQSVDIAKGILIILVVVAHAQNDIVHDVIFLFHMPLFFLVSGFLLKREKILRKGYVLKKIKHLIVTYLVYLVLDMILVRNTFYIGDWIYTIWGGRAISGVYWYMTCYLFALFLFSILLRRFSDRTVKCLILIGGGYSCY